MQRHWVGLLVAAAAMAADQGAVLAQLPVWQVQESGTTAGLRGIDSVDGQVAWASGTGGTVLRTVDGGAHWMKCAVPDADKDGGTLDFRGVQAWDAKTAIVMASGVGEKSRLYKTVDGCGTWALILKNSNKDGFWDAVKFSDRNDGFLLGDPVDGKYVLMGTNDGGTNWTRVKGPSLKVENPKSGVFAASNSSLLFSATEPAPSFVTSGPGGAFFYGGSYQYTEDGRSGADLCRNGSLKKPPAICLDSLLGFQVLEVGVTGTNQSSGGFSIAAANLKDYRAVIVGGDYTKPDVGAGSAAYLDRRFEGWLPSTKPPRGYRSAVQWSEPLKVWITAGTNGSDISRDDGRTWRTLDDGNWNALSLPFIVGPNGRIGRLNAGALPKP